MELKQVILVRTDLRLPSGKMAAQVAHASVECVMRSEKSDVKEWKAEGGKKIVLKVDGLAELYTYNQQAKDAGLVTAMITDGGLTVVPPGTVTCLGIGPAPEEKIDSVTGSLKML
ncbi:MAG: peptidyl-tRNA hydrolase Pth2 [Nanoarchaeota archaeon]